VRFDRTTTAELVAAAHAAPDATYSAARNVGSTAETMLPTTASRFERPCRSSIHWRVLNVRNDPRYKVSVTTTIRRPRFAPPDRGVVHVWCVPLPADGAPDVSCLSASEGRRLALRNGEAAHRFGRAHVALRQVVAAYEGCSPHAVRLAAGYGERPRAASGLELSLSHCDDLALVAVATSVVGIDVEPVAAGEPRADELDDLAHATLTCAELELLERTTAAERPALWLALWVRKEALLKARGAGLGEIPLYELEAGGERSDDLALLDLRPDDAHLGAVALAARAVRIEWKELDDES
jgi:4'-phosphopantetheinyl transferase